MTVSPPILLHKSALRRRIPATRSLAVLLLWALVMGCGAPETTMFGQPVDAIAAVPLARALDSADENREIVVVGRIGEVCRSAGCWFVLQDSDDDRHVQVMVDLKPLADFIVPSDVSGRRAIVAGRLVGAAPDVELHATGLRLEPGT